MLRRILVFSEILAYLLTTISQAPIQHNAEVGLFCHSYHAGGSYTNLNNPPKFAPFLASKDGEAQLRVFKLDQKWMVDSGMTHPAVANDQRWQFLQPQHGTIQALMEKSDLGQTNDVDDAQIEAYRTVFDQSKWGAAHEVLIPQVNLTMLKNMPGMNGMGMELFKEKIKTTMAENVKKNVKQWQDANGITDLQPLRLRVKFVD